MPEDDPGTISDQELMVKIYISRKNEILIIQQNSDYNILGFFIIDPKNLFDYLTNCCKTKYLFNNEQNLSDCPQKDSRLA